jgi:hypothetical protein
MYAVYATLGDVKLALAASVYRVVKLLFYAGGS